MYSLEGQSPADWTEIIRDIRLAESVLILPVEKSSFFLNKLHKVYCILGQIPGFQWNLAPPPSLYDGKDGDIHFLRNTGNFLPVQANLFPD